MLGRIEVNGGMNETTTAKKEKTYVNYLSEKKRNKAIYAMLPYYENVIILGDSLAESILDYRLLRKKNVIAKRGRCVDMIEGDIQRAICMAPEMIILEYGKNDILHFRDNFTSFITLYRKHIHTLKEELPETTLYVNSLIPMGQCQLERIGGLEVFKTCNSLLQLMCEKEGIGFIDNTALIEWKDELFEFDGIHPKYPLYPKWLYHMADILGLLKRNFII